jgi:hypothetical protein
MKQILINLVEGALGGVGAGKSSPTFLAMIIVEPGRRLLAGLTECRDRALNQILSQNMQGRRSHFSDSLRPVT